MKKFSVLLLSVLFVSFSFTSCSSDDDDNGGSGDVTLVGTWQFSKEGMVVDGTEQLEDWEHWAPECGLDHIVFNANNTGVAVDYDIWDDECEEWEEPFEWSLEGGVLTLEDGFETVELEVVELSASTLKVYEEMEWGGETIVYVTVLTKI